MFRLRREIAAGKRWGPRMYLSGPWGLDSTKSVRGNLTAYKAAGYDHVKWYGESPRIPVWTNEKDPKRRFDSLSVVARELGLPLAAHGAGGNFSATLRMGLKSIEHLVPYPKHDSKDSVSLQEAVAATVRDHIWNVPTPYLINTTLGSLGRKYIRAELRMMMGVEPDSERVRTALNPQSEPQDSSGKAAFLQHDRVIKALQDGGAGLLTGSDLPFLLTGYTIPRQFQAFVRAGLTPYQSLAAGTRNPALYFGTLDSTGTVTVGKRADLVLLAGNPLEDIRHTSDVAGVMVQGRWIDRAHIERELDHLYGRWMKPLPPGTKSYD